MSTQKTMTKEVDVQKELSKITGKYTVIFAKPTWIAESGLMDKNKHDGAIKLTNTHDGIQRCPVNELGQLVTGLTYEQQVAFETALNMEEGALSPYPKRDPKTQRENICFWTDWKNVIQIPKEGLKLDCDNNIEHKLIYLNLMAACGSNNTGMISKSLQEAENNPNARWVMLSEEVELKAIGDKGLILDKAFKRYGSLTPSEKRDFFKLYRHKNLKYNAGDYTKQSLVDAKILEVVQKDPETFVEILEDKNFKDLVLLEDLISNQILKVKGTRIMTQEEEVLGNSKSEAVNNLHNKDFQDLKIALLSRLESVTKK